MLLLGTCLRNLSVLKPFSMNVSVLSRASARRHLEGSESVLYLYSLFTEDAVSISETFNQKPILCNNI